MPKCADTEKQKISQYRWLPISEPIIGATLPLLVGHNGSPHGNHIETAEEGKLTPELAVLAIQTAPFLMGNAHQHIAQERPKHNYFDEPYPSSEKYGE